MRGPLLSMIVLGCIALSGVVLGAPDTPVRTVPTRSAQDIIESSLKPRSLSEVPYRPDSPFGICHLGADAAHLNNLGLTWNRNSLPAFTVDRAEKWASQRAGNFPFNDEAREVLDEGAHVLGLIHFVKSDGKKWADDENRSYLSVVETCTYNMVRTHRKQVDYWEVMNEPDLFAKSLSVEDVSAITKTAVKAARRADPDCTILSPSPTSFSYMEDLLEQGIGDIVDGFAVHVYAQGAGLSQKTEQWKRLFEEYGYGHKPVWVTETGFRTDAPHSESGEQIRREWERRLAAQARYIVTSHVRLLAKGIDKVMWYQYTDVKNVHAKENWGLLWSVNGNGKRAGWPRKQQWLIKSPHTAVKPAGLSHHAMARKLADKTFEQKLNAGLGVHMYRFTGPEASVIVAWADRKTTCQIPVRDETLRVTNMYGKELRFQARNGVCNLRLTREPIYLEGVALPQLQMRECTINWASDTRLSRGREKTLPVTLTNETMEDFSGRIVFSGSPGLLVRPSSKPVRLPEGGEEEVTLRVEAAPGLPTGSHVIRSIVYQGEEESVSENEAQGADSVEASLQDPHPVVREHPVQVVE